VENPREIVAPGDEVKVKILEIDSERRRLSLSIKRVEGQVLPRRTEGITDAGDLEDMPELGLSEDVFAEQPQAEVEAPEVEELEAEAPETEEPVAEEPAAEEPAAEESDVEAEAPDAAADELPEQPGGEDTEEA
jgi:small subunit ribosomal protein S1